ncbi:hypothetical protein [Anaerostipes rhamnosivorans]|jgi:hypothetical protein|uniref:Uncharacterized protein n=1 Tax=Anaerostipes rhamnosivorans TaxID=1229621 RepID=A0A4P8IHP2_9FIRM|nr:hypothetical protein [Anaerostipes rhamnosivorans]QCP36531.1 hypothetical protein AR1Y2_3077 [Anaerostipes rhamnosivorans]
MEHLKRLTEEEPLQRTNQVLMYVAELLQQENLITIDERVFMTEALQDEI